MISLVDLICFAPGIACVVFLIGCAVGWKIGFDDGIKERESVKQEGEEQG